MGTWYIRVISCDAAGCMRVREELAHVWTFREMRARLRGEGWARSVQQDFCPDHKEAVPGVPADGE